MTNYEKIRARSLITMAYTFCEAADCPSYPVKKECFTRKEPEKNGFEVWLEREVEEDG